MIPGKSDDDGDDVGFPLLLTTRIGTSIDHPHAQTHAKFELFCYKRPSWVYAVTSLLRTSFVRLCCACRLYNPVHCVKKGFIIELDPICNILSHWHPAVSNHPQLSPVEMTGTDCAMRNWAWVVYY